MVAASLARVIDEILPPCDWTSATCARVGTIWSTEGFGRRAYRCETHAQEVMRLNPWGRVYRPHPIPIIDEE
jgi:hypothetical protein